MGQARVCGPKSDHRSGEFIFNIRYKIYLIKSRDPASVNNVPLLFGVLPRSRFSGAFENLRNSPFKHEG
jgi:hypothetical protein